VEAFLSGLAVRSQGPHFVRGSRGPDRDAPRSAGRAGRAPRVPHTDAELALLLATARERLNPGQDTLDLGDVATVAPGVEDVADWTAGRRAGQATLDENLDQAGHSRQSMTSKSSRSAGGRPASFNAGGRVVATSSQLLWQVLTDAYTRLGLDVLADEAFRNCDARHRRLRSSFPPRTRQPTTAPRSYSARLSAPSTARPHASSCAPAAWTPAGTRNSASQPSATAPAASRSHTVPTNTSPRTRCAASLACTPLSRHACSRPPKPLTRRRSLPDKAS
jgi:hypothetical protein